MKSALRCLERAFLKKWRHNQQRKKILREKNIKNKQKTIDKKLLLWYIKARKDESNVQVKNPST